MKLYLVRHGETDWNGKKQLQGWADIPLNDRGIMQAEALRDKINQQSLAFEVCYSSPLARAFKTAAIITRNITPIVQDDLLKERGFGDVEGKILKSWDEFGVDIFDEILNTDINHIEPILSVQKRADDFLTKIQQNHNTNATILVVSSAGLLKRMLYSIHQDRSFTTNQFHVNNCELIEVEI